MERQQSPSAYTGELTSLNCPINLKHLERLRGLAMAQGPELVIDHGCGWGEILLGAIESSSSARGIGIDLSAFDIERAQSAAEKRGLQERVTFIQGSSEDHRNHADVLISMGAYQAFGDVATSLKVLRHDLRTGGRALFGVEYWARTPTDDQLSHMWPGATVDDCLFLPELVDQVHQAGWQILDLHDSDRSEFDAFELGHFRRRNLVTSAVASSG